MSRLRKAEFPAAAESARKRLLATIHIKAQELRLDDESYRDVLERVTGKRSAALVDDRFLYEVVKEFDRLAGKPATAAPVRKSRPLADAPMARRARALWLCLWHLDELDSGTEDSLAAFVTRQTAKLDLRWCNARELTQVIEALKDWCVRAGLDRAAMDANPKAALVRLQWRRLCDCGWAAVKNENGLLAFARRGSFLADKTIEQANPAELNDLAKRLGAIVRAQKAGSRRKADPRD